MLQDELGPWMEARSWSLSAEGLERLETLLGLWLRYGAVMNLSGARTRSELLPHVLDGLDTAWIVREAVADTAALRWADFGSGGGFPGLVVGAVLDCDLRLLEPRQKRAGFLELALAAIGRGSIAVLRERYDQATWCDESMGGFLEPADGGAVVVSARAVWGPEEWLRVARHITTGVGHVVMHVSSENLARKFGCGRVIASERGAVGLVLPSAGG
ncbi:MAG: class I SAM-dependent methyltransferase [Nannocystaceae bacterium]|nr:class I SAM-dependent methyltransferase [Nannocystaceae bacterium]